MYNYLKLTHLIHIIFAKYNVFLQFLLLKNVLLFLLGGGGQTDDLESHKLPKKFCNCGLD